MSSSIVLPPRWVPLRSAKRWYLTPLFSSFGYVAAGLVSTVWVLGWQMLVVGKHRKRSGIKYPQRVYRWCYYNVWMLNRGVLQCMPRKQKPRLLKTPSSLTALSVNRHSPNIWSHSYSRWFLGAHQNTIEHMPIVVVTWVFCWVPIWLLIRLRPV
jgi:hypothetical protein